MFVTKCYSFANVLYSHIIIICKIRLFFGIRADRSKINKFDLGHRVVSSTYIRLRTSSAGLRNGRYIVLCTRLKRNEKKIIKNQFDDFNGSKQYYVRHFNWLIVYTAVIPQSGLFRCRYTNTPLPVVMRASIYYSITYYSTIYTNSLLWYTSGLR